MWRKSGRVVAHEPDSMAGGGREASDTVREASDAVREVSDTVREAELRVRMED